MNSDANLNLSSTVSMGNSLDAVLKSCGQSGLTPEELGLVIPGNTQVRSFHDIHNVCPKFERVVFNGFAMNIVNDTKRMMQRIKKSYRGD